MRLMIGFFLGMLITVGFYEFGDTVTLPSGNIAQHAEQTVQELDLSVVSTITDTVAHTVADTVADTVQEVGTSVGALGEAVPEVDYTFYDNFFKSTVTLIEGAYDVPLKDPNRTYYVQIGSFSDLERAQSFRGGAILDGYSSRDIHVESSETHHRVVIGPFAESALAEAAEDWAVEHQYSALRLTRSSDKPGAE